MTFKKLNILFMVLLIVASWAVLLHAIPWWAIFLLVPVYAIWIIYGAITIHSNFFMDVISSAEKKGKLALTFDDGPHPEHTPRMLNLLDERGIKATFFLLGRQVVKHPELAKEIVDRGHLVANHTNTHPLTWGMMSVNSLAEEVTTTTELIKKATGKTTRYFRPPFGVINPKVVKMVEKLNLDVIGWDLRSRDGGPLKRDQIYKMAKPQLESSSIMLFHDTNPETYFALQKILDDCQQLGLEIVPLDKLIEKQAYA